MPVLLVGVRLDHVALGLELADRLTAVAVMILEALLVAAQLLLEVARRLVEARMGFAAGAFRLQHEAGGEVERQVGVEGASLLLHGHMCVNRAVEILLLDLAEAGFDVFTQGVADIEVLTGDFDLHGRRKYPCFAPALHMGAFG